MFDQALQAWVDAGAESPARQTWPDFLVEVNGALDDLGAGLRSGQTGIAFSSSGVIAALAASLIGLSDRAFVPLNRVSVNTSITKVIVGSRGKTLVSYNDHSHLEDARQRRSRDVPLSCPEIRRAAGRCTPPRATAPGQSPLSNLNEMPSRTR